MIFEVHFNRPATSNAPLEGRRLPATPAESLNQQCSKLPGDDIARNIDDDDDDVIAASTSSTGGAPVDRCLSAPVGRRDSDSTTYPLMLKRNFVDFHHFSSFFIRKFYLFCI